MAARFAIEKGSALTECDCPENLCTHGWDRMREYPVWEVVDRQYPDLDLGFWHLEFDRYADARLRRQSLARRASSGERMPWEDAS